MAGLALTFACGEYDCSHEQGLSDRLLSLDELYAPEAVPVLS
ncbi:MAG TPA: hypothetical protein VKU60_03840 [Chloroflexota bacterium]|nr:hypothetical protein [Chloroflexota bacterium]